MREDNRVRDAAALAARVVLGGSMAAHGAQKLFGWFGGSGMKAATGMMQQLGFSQPERYARAASATEVASGALIALGALGPIGPAMLASTMTTAVGTVHLPKGYFNTGGGYEMNTMYALLGLLLAVDDYGRMSVDEAIGLRGKIPPLLSVVVFAGGVAAGIAALRQRNKPEKPPKVVVGEVEASSKTVESAYTPGI